MTQINKSFTKDIIIDEFKKRLKNDERFKNWYPLNKGLPNKWEVPNSTYSFGFDNRRIYQRHFQYVHNDLCKVQTVMDHDLDGFKFHVGYKCCINKDFEVIGITISNNLYSKKKDGLKYAKALKDNFDLHSKLKMDVGLDMNKNTIVNM